MLAIGLMSGTSLDGIDAVLCEIDGVDESTKIKTLDFVVLEMPVYTKEKILSLLKNETDILRHLTSLNVELGHLFADAVELLLNRNRLSAKDISYVANHGQTIYHLPHPLASEFKGSLQIGESSIIAYRTQIQVIDNFRVMDMAADGQGAPLVPLSERILFAQKGKRIGLLNVGGIANITLLSEEIIAFDTGPGNMMMDEVMRKLFQREYDENGELALSGKHIEALFDELIQHPYLKLPFPKSTGRELFGESYVKDLLERYSEETAQDLMRTLTEFTAYCVVESIQQQAIELDQLIISGGGAYNLALLSELRKRFKNEVLTQEDLGFRSDAKEAIAFVILGNQFMHHRPGNVPSATGAKEALVLGKLTPVPFI